MCILYIVLFFLKDFVLFAHPLPCFLNLTHSSPFFKFILDSGWLSRPKGTVLLGKIHHRKKSLRRLQNHQEQFHSCRRGEFHTGSCVSLSQARWPLTMGRCPGRPTSILGTLYAKFPECSDLFSRGRAKSRLMPWCPESAGPGSSRSWEGQERTRAGYWREKQPWKQSGTSHAGLNSVPNSYSLFGNRIFVDIIKFKVAWA